MKKIYCTNCFFYENSCCMNTLFVEEIEEEIKNPFTPVYISKLKRKRENGILMDCEYLNKNNDCPYFKKKSFWQLLRRLFP